MGGWVGAKGDCVDYKSGNLKYKIIKHILFFLFSASYIAALQIRFKGRGNTTT